MASPLGASSDAFIQNVGQWDGQAQFLSRTQGADVWVTESGAVYDLYRTQKAGEKTIRKGHVVRMEFVDGLSSRVSGQDEVPGRFNYFFGNDSSNWASNVPRYAEVRSERVYDGVEARWYVDQGSPRYDLVVAPGADPARIAMRFDGAQGISAKGTTLSLNTSLGEVQQRGLFAYQKINGAIKQVPSSFRVQGNTVRFEVGAYDRTKPLVIDPIVWATFLGGTVKDTANDWAVDPSGNIVVCGDTTSADFPTTVGAYDSTKNGAGADYDMFIAKLSADGTSLLSSTYLGTSSSESASGVATDINGNIYLCGQTFSTTFPMVNSYDSTSNGGWDAVLAKFSPSLSTIQWSTYFGGSDSDSIDDLTVYTDNGTEYVMGVGSSFSLNLPLAGGYDITTNGSADALLVRFNGTGSYLAGSVYGGTFYDKAVSVARDPSGNIVVYGETSSTNLPMVGTPYDNTGLGTELYLARFNPTLTTLQASTYLGGAGFELAGELDIDSAGNVYLAGYTYGNGFPTTGNGFDQTFAGGPRDGFLTVLDNALSSLVYSTFLGGTDDDISFGVDVDAAGRVAVVGNTRSTDFQTTPGAYDTTHNGGDDVFVAYFDPGFNIIESTLMGSVDYEFGRFVHVLGDRQLLIGGATYTSLFASTPGAYDTTYNGDEDAFLLRYSVGNGVTSVTTAKTSYIGGFAVPVTITLQSPVANGTDVALSTDTPSKVILPATTKFKAGTTSKVFSARTESVKTDTPVTISATLGGVTKTASITLTPGGLLTLKVSPSTMTTLTSGVGFVTLSGPAPDTGRNVLLWTDRSDVFYMPTGVRVSGGQTLAGFPTQALIILSSVNVTCYAKLGTMTKTDTVTLNP